jgi:hypothetical protein
MLLVTALLDTGLVVVAALVAAGLLFPAAVLRELSLSAAIFVVSPLPMRTEAVARRMPNYPIVVRQNGTVHRNARAKQSD